MSKRRQAPVDLACVIRVTDEPSEAALNQALALAEARGAHLTLLLGVQSFSAPFTPFFGGMTSSIAAEINAKSRKTGEALAERVTEAARSAGVALTVEIVEGHFNEMAARAALAARAADLVIVDEQHGALDGAAVLIEEALFRSGRPVLVASQKRPPIRNLARIAIGWDGSAHAVRATAAALALFPELAAAELVMVSGDKPRANSLPGADFARHLARHGLDVTLTTLDRGKHSIGATLLAHSKATHADALVTGAFGHARLLEFLLGGVTVELTAAAELPILMAY
jgi:nucleotide-binding universal stress UspA family protein